MDIDQFDSQNSKAQETQSSHASTIQIDSMFEDSIESQDFKQTPPTIRLLNYCSISFLEGNNWTDFSLDFSEFDLTSGWETIKNNVDANQSVVTVDLSNSELPLTQGEDGEQVFLLFIPFKY